LHGVAVANDAGVATVTITPPITEGEYVDIVVTKNQYIPYIAQIPIAILPQFCEMPLNLEGDVEECDATIGWKEPKNIDGKLLGYNIYRDEEKINEELLIEPEFTDKDLENGTYAYQVSAVYEHCDESELTEAIIVVIDCQNINCNKPVNMSVEPGICIAIITWNEPENINGKLLGYNIYRNEEKINGRKMCFVFENRLFLYKPDMFKIAWQGQ